MAYFLNTQNLYTVQVYTTYLMIYLNTVPASVSNAITKKMNILIINQFKIAYLHTNMELTQHVSQKPQILYINITL